MQKETRLEKKVLCSFRFPESVRDKLRKMACKNNYGMTEALRQLIEKEWEGGGHEKTNSMS